MLGLVSYFRRDVVRGGRRIGLGDPVVAARRVIALPTDAEQRQRLLEISRSRTEPTGRVERARIILAERALDESPAILLAQGPRPLTHASCCLSVAHAAKTKAGYLQARGPKSYVIHDN